MFIASDLTLERSDAMNRSVDLMVYRSVVLKVLLYGVESWAPTQELVNKLDRFHQCCVCSILGVGRFMQWKNHFTTAELAGRFGMVESIGNLLTQCRLRWLGHIARMSDTRRPEEVAVWLVSSEASCTWY